MKQGHLNRKLGWKPGLKRHHALKYTDVSLVKEGLPAVVDLSSQFSPVEDQGQLGSCVANAVCGVLEFLQLKELKAGGAPGPSNPEEFKDKVFHDMSRLFLYFNARVLDGTSALDNGTSVSSAAKALSKWGVCREQIWPYHISQFATPPSHFAYGEAFLHKEAQALAINAANPAFWMNCLASGYPVAFGIPVYSGFMSQETAESGMVPMPQDGEEEEGGHALVLVGYDASKRKAKGRNSWGTDWGMDGYFEIDFDYITQYADDLHTFRFNQVGK